MTFINAGFIPIILCETEKIDKDPNKGRKFKEQQRNFSIRHILQKPIKNVINIDDTNDQLNEV